MIEDIAEKVKSTKYIECLEKLNDKYPDANLSYSVEVAKSIIK